MPRVFQALLLPLSLAGALIAVAAVLASAAPTHAAGTDSVYFPDGYRRWPVAKFKFIGPESPNWEGQGGLRHHFANDVALASWGRFRDGAVIVDERVHAALQPRQVWEETALAHVAVMRKDAAGHADTGGWQFNFFTGGDTTRGITREQAKARCFDACHKAQEARDYVFSDPRR
jgi:hypothetical protein